MACGAAGLVRLSLPESPFTQNKKPELFGTSEALGHTHEAQHSIALVFICVCVLSTSCFTEALENGGVLAKIQFHAKYY